MDRLTATSLSGGGWNTIIASELRSTGTLYCELQPQGAFTNPGWFAIGISEPTEPGGHLGSCARSFGWFSNGPVWRDGATFATFDTYAVNDWLAMFVNFDTRKIRFRNITAAGAWSAEYDFAAGMTLPVGAAATLAYNGTTNSILANFGATAFLGAPP